MELFGELGDFGETGLFAGYNALAVFVNERVMGHTSRSVFHDTGFF